ncbi:MULTISPECIES: trypsin-like peptidase domain-containing protein [Stutzerimonas]|uniref:trypsin-like peptidase domain-containing protein n=1 Tax=Stutzerimonas TaxID=2901164 RepID=UPI002898F30C|nr:trypsin-like peptidase domain-containing protein [Stutzerimonas kunmingensis]
MRIFSILILSLFSAYACSEEFELQQESIRLPQVSLENLTLSHRVPIVLVEANNGLYRDGALGRRPEIEIPVPGSEFEPNREVLETHTGSRVWNLDGLPSVLCSNAARAFRNKSTETRLKFIAECLTDRLPDNEAVLVGLLKNLVYLSNSDPEAPDVCTGLLLSKTRVLTAAHCRARKVFLSDGTTRKVERKEDCVPYLQIYCDHSFIEIYPASFDPVRISMAKPVLGSRLWIPGYAVEDIFRDPDGPEIPKVKWEKFGHNSCVVEYSREGCFAHMCQVIGGFSGAPVVDVAKSVREKNITVVGMHITSVIRDTSCSQDIPEDELIMNFAVPIDSVAISES